MVGYVVLADLLLAFTNNIQDATLTKFAGYSEEEILPVFELLIDYLQAPVAHEALFKKYASKKFLKGMCLSPSNPMINMLTFSFVASILSRKWAKDYCSSLRSGGVSLADTKGLSQ